MLDVLGEEQGVLYYNAFGTVEILEDRINVNVHFSRNGFTQARTATYEAKNLQNVQRPLIYSFGAWVVGLDDHYLIFEERKSYDQNVFELNRKLITSKVHLILNDVVGKISM